MKILMLGWELPPHNSGGLGVACYNLAKALSGQGINIDFVIPFKFEFERFNNVNVLAATNININETLKSGAYESLNIDDKVFYSGNNHLSIRDVQKEYAEYVDKYLANNHPDVVHAHDWLTYEAGMMAKQKYHIPLIAHVHATEFDRAGMQNGNPLIHEIEYEGLMMADRIIAVSETTKRIIHEKYKIPLSKIEVVYNSLDESYNEKYEFSDQTYHYIEQLKERGYTIIATVGRLTIQKGLSHLLRAVKNVIDRNPKTVLLLAGDGEERNRLIQLSADLGISKNIIFTGFIRGKKLRDIYSISDIFIMSSVSEPFGLTALEAAHHGNALILSRQSGVSEIIWSALKYNYWDEQKLADGIIALIDYPVLQTTLKYNAKEEYRRITWNKIAQKCINIYNGLSQGQR
ncbi:glycosyltransferase family 4 protein [Candidatus Saccharibacteria bacterium]|nr:glycosyltransferase family 4 protein [Candidatus Saccharibacteria bacterium]